MLKTKRYMKILLYSLVTAALGYCSPKSETATPTPTPVTTTPENQVDVWMTKGDQSSKLAKQNTLLHFNTTYNTYPTIEVDNAVSFQSMEGFGYTLTGGSAIVINQLTPDKRKALLEELFGSGDNSIRISYLRVSIGASDLDESVFSYDDLPVGETDPTLLKFSLDPDRKNLIPLLQDILRINPSIKILGSPWSAPVWMKDNTNSKGGSLLKSFQSVYARYIVKYILQMKELGIPIHAITPQNEPLHPGNNPSMLMLADQEADFIRNDLGPAIQAAGLQTGIIVYDHNCDRPDYPLSILRDPVANGFVTGSAFHLYGGDISALSTVHNAFPDKGLYFTEQWTSATGDFATDLAWHTKNVMIGSMRNWSKVALEWNLANNAAFGPHTPGGCSACKGAITVQDPNTFQRNVSYYIIAHASKFIGPGSVRIGSNQSGNLNNAAFRTPEGKTVLLVENDNSDAVIFNIRQNGQWVTTSLPGGAVATYLW